MSERLTLTSPTSPDASVDEDSPMSEEFDQRRPTLAVVAQLAGVSLKTASRAINGERHVAADTRERVLAVATSVGFRINAMASQLKRGVDPHVVSLITGDLANPFYSAIAKGVEREVRRHGMSLTISSSDEDPQSERTLVEEFLTQRVRALLIVSTLDEHREFRMVQERGVPVVFLDRSPVGLNADSFVIDNYTGTREAVEQFLALGHRRIGFIGDFARLATHRERYRAFGDAMAAAGVLNWEQYTRSGARDVESAADVVTELLGMIDPPTAFFASNNRITMGAVKVLRQLAPETALIGFDDFELADVLGITTVSHDPAEMGRLAALKALDCACVPQNRIEPTILPTRLVQRGSGERLPALV